MKQGTKKSLLFVGSALAVAVGIVAVGIILDIHDIHWGRWFELAWWTAGIFGCAAVLYSRDLRKARCLLVYVVAIVAHVAVLALYLRRAEAFPNFFFLFFSPFEIVAVGVILLAIGGAKPHSAWRAANPRHRTRHPRE